MRISRASLALTTLLTLGSPLTLPALLGAASAQAQDEWDVSGGDSRRKEILRRYKVLVESNPVEGLAYNKMVEYAGGARGIDALIKEYEGKTSESPDKVVYWIILGHLRKTRSDYEGAEKAYDEALKREQDNPIALLGRGASRQMLQRNAEATQDFERALSLEKDKTRKQEILRKLADLAFAQRDWEKAQEYYDRLVALEPRSEYLRMEYAQVLIKYKRYDKALEQYEEILKLAGRDVKTRATTMRDIGELYELTGDTDKALSTYRDAQKLVKSDNWLYRELEQRVIGIYRRTDKLGEYAEDRAKQWKSPSYDQAMMLASLFEELGQEDKAFDYYTLASRKSSRSVDPRNKLIQILLRRGDNKAVLKAYQDLIRVAPREARYQFDLAKLYFRNGDRESAKKTLKKVQSSFGRDPDVMVTLADNYMRFGFNDEALDVYKQLVRVQPRNETYLLGLGEYYYQSGETTKALEVWERLLKSDLGKAEAHAQYGLVLVEHGMVERGIEQYQKAAQLMPEDPEVQRGLAVAYEMGRYWDEAIATWEKLMKGEPGSPVVSEARSRIVAIYKRQNKLRTKLAEFKAAFEATPPDIDAGFFLAEAYLKLSEAERAERVWLQIIDADGKLDAQDLPALQELEKVYAQRGESQKAIGVLQKLAELRPARAREYYQRIAELSLKTYDDDQAVEYAQLALEKNPDDAAAHAKLGDVYAKMARYEDAIKSYKESLDLDPRAYDVYFKLAQLLLETGQDEEAFGLYLYVAKKAPDEVMVLQASRRLMSLVDGEQELFMLEQELAPEVFKGGGLQTIYRKVLLEIYGRMGGLLVARRNAGAQLDAAELARLDQVGVRAFPVLMDALQSEDVGQRQMAMRMLGELRLNAAAVALARMVGDEKDPLRLSAAVATARIGEARSAQILSGALEDQDAGVREVATWALGALGEQAVVPDLIRAMREGKSAKQRALAALSLGRVGGKKAQAALLAELEQAKERRYHDTLAMAVVLGLGMVAEPDQVAPLEDVLVRGVGAAGDGAAWALGRIGGPAAARILLDGYWSGDRDLRERARRGLVWLATAGAQESVEGSSQRFLTEARFVNERATSREIPFDVEGLFTSLSRDVLYSPMIDPSLLFTQYGDVVREVAVAKSKQEDRAVQVMLFNDLTREDLVLGLGQLGAPSAEMEQSRQQVLQALRPALIASLALRGDLAKERAAIGMLGQVHDAADLDLVLSRKGDEDVLIRREVVRALGHGYAQDSRAVEALLDALEHDSSPDVRAQAAWALGESEAGGSLRSQAISKLEQSLSDRSMLVQVEAALALSRLGAKEAVGALGAKLEGLPREVLYARLEALSRLGTKEAEQALAPWRKHIDVRVREAIARGGETR